MTPEQFSQLAAEGYNRIPICREILADLDTPLTAYLKLAKGPYSYLLESVEGGEKNKNKLPILWHLFPTLWGHFAFHNYPICPASLAA